MFALGATSAVTVSGLHIADVLRFTGAFAALVCVYCIPACVQWKEMAAAAAVSKTGWAARIAMAASLGLFGVFVVAVQFVS